MDNSYEKNNFAKNLRYLREDSGRTQEQLAEVLGIKRANITAWETNKTIPSKFGTIRMISDLFGVTCDDLLFRDLRVSSIDKAPKNPPKTITVYGKVCAGNGFEALENPIDEIGDPYYRIKEEKIALVVEGDSMNNVVNDGMYAIIEKRPIVSNGEIAVVLIDNEIGMLKRFYQLDDMVILRPDSSNPEHKPLTFIGEDINSLKILGRYLGCVSPMERLL